MARRRYLSTDISHDKGINKLAAEYGDFAALLYTWLIPHAEDDATLAGDPEEILYIVIPGRRDKTPSDVAAALTGMVACNLIVWDREADIIYFKLSSFYKYQTYMTTCYGLTGADRRISLPSSPFASQTRFGAAIFCPPGRSGRNTTPSA